MCICQIKLKLYKTDLKTMLDLSSRKCRAIIFRAGQQLLKWKGIILGMLVVVTGRLDQVIAVPGSAAFSSGTAEQPTKSQELRTAT